MNLNGKAHKQNKKEEKDCQKWQQHIETERKDKNKSTFHYHLRQQKKGKDAVKATKKRGGLCQSKTITKNNKKREEKREVRLRPLGV